MSRLQYRKAKILCGIILATAGTNVLADDKCRFSANASCEFALGLSWRWFYFKTTYWFLLDRRVLSGENPTYDYDKNLIFSLGARFSF